MIALYIPKTSNEKNIFSFVQDIRMIIARGWGIKDYKNKSKEYLTKLISESKPKINLFENKIKEIKKDFSELKHRFAKSKINEFIKSIYNIKIQKNLFPSKIKDAKKYYDYDNTKYQGIRDTVNLLGKVDEGYYKPIKNKSAFNDNYIEYESKGDRDKDLWLEEYLQKIRPYLRNMINYHKTRRECKIQLTMQINFISHKDSEGTHTMYLKSRNIEIMMGNKTDEIIKKLFESVLQNYQKNLEEPVTASKFVPDSINLLYYHFQKNRFEKRRIIHRFS